LILKNPFFLIHTFIFLNQITSLHRKFLQEEVRRRYQIRFSFRKLAGLKNMFARIVAKIIKVYKKGYFLAHYPTAKDARCNIATAWEEKQVTTDNYCWRYDLVITTREYVRKLIRKEWRKKEK